MQQDFLYDRLRFTRAVNDLFRKTLQNLEDELIEHALDEIKVKRRYRMISQVCRYQDQIFRKIPRFTIESRLDLDQCLQQIHNEISILVAKNS